MNYIGDKYGRLTVVETHSAKRWVGGKTNRFKSKTVARCECECGNEIEVPINSLRTGNTKSCGCYESDRTKQRNFKHGYGNHPLKGTYYSMLRRCNNPDHQSYKHYGGRGIKVCKEWETNIGAFIKWAEANGYRKGLQLDREDNDKGYSPNNCRFITTSENHRNTRANVKYGDECLKDFLERISKENDIPFPTVRYRYYRMLNNNIKPTEKNIVDYNKVKSD